MTFLQTTSSCNCTEGYFVFGEIENERGGYCKECYSTCSLCNSDAKDDCWKCKKGYFLKNGECVIDCGVGYFGEKK